MSGDITWTFEVVPQTNMPAVARHDPLDASTAHTGDDRIDRPLSRHSPPRQISIHGEFNSHRGCRGTFGSVGTTEATRIETDFTGTDCQQGTFTARIVLTKS